MRAGFFWLLGAAITLYFFGFGSTPEKPAPAKATSSFATSATDDVDAGKAIFEAASDGLSGETFESVGDRSACTKDCSGHNAGFEWAKNHDVTDASECGGKSQSFIEGCEAYADALERLEEEVDEDGES